MTITEQTEQYAIGDRVRFIETDNVYSSAAGDISYGCEGTVVELLSDSLHVQFDHLNALSGIRPSRVEKIEQESTDEDQESEYDDAKKRFADLVKNSRSSSYERLKDEVAELEDNYNRRTSQARDLLWRLNDRRNELASIQVHENDRNESLESEFDALMRHSMVEAIGLREQEVVIKTTDIMMNNPDEGYEKELGQLEIQIPVFSGRADQLLVKNRTNARTDRDGGTWDHPHIRNNIPCYGAFESQITTALSNGELIAAFELMLQYLQTINPDDDYGQNWDLWD